MSYSKKLLIACLLIFGATISKSQSIDSIEFSNTVEAECFQNIKDKKELNAFNLLMVTNSKNVDNSFLKSSYQKIQSFVNGYDLNNPKLKSIASIKDIYKRVHSTFLINYDTDVDFKDIFETGKYNCVTASSLFALILDKLSIEYLIKETPAHVYLIVDPKGNNVVFETTAPGAPILNFNTKVKETFIEYLEKNKLVGKEEVNQVGLDSVFNKYYFSDKPISMVKLISLQYYNQGVEYLNKSDYKSAFKEFQKSGLLFSDERINYLQSVCLISIVTQGTKNEESLLYLVKFANITYSETNQIIFKEYYSFITNELLIKKQELDRYKLLSEKTYTHLKDSVAKADVQYISLYNFSKYYYYKNQFPECLISLDKLYSSNKTDLEIHNLITATTDRILSPYMGTTKYVDETEKYLKKYSFLKENSDFLYNYIMTVSKLSMEGYEFEEFVKGEKYLNKLKILLKENEANTLGIKGEMSAKAFGAAAGYYVRKQQYKTAQGILKNGLYYLPENAELKNRLKTITSYMGKK